MTRVVFVNAPGYECIKRRKRARFYFANVSKRKDIARYSDPALDNLRD